MINSTKIDPQRKLCLLASQKTMKKKYSVEEILRILSQPTQPGRQHHLNFPLSFYSGQPFVPRLCQTLLQTSTSILDGRLQCGKPLQKG